MKNKTHHQGRTKGSFSYSALTLADAAKINNNPTFKFLFSRKQLESLGATNLVTDRVSNLTESLVSQKPTNESVNQPVNETPAVVVQEL